jgi:hypothetical protein
MKVEQSSKEDLLIGRHIGGSLFVDTPSWSNQRRSFVRMLKEIVSQVLEDATCGFRDCDVME